MDARKLEKKLRRKQAQISVKLPKWNISFSDEPTQYVYVGNGGIQAGVSHKLLKSVLCEDAVSIHMIPSMDFAFVVFKNKEMSMRTLQNLNGSCVQQLVEDKCLQELVPATLLSGPPIHLLMAYVYELPPQLSIQQCNTIERDLPPGCHILYEFVSQGEEQKLLQYFSKHDKLIGSPGQLGDEDLIETNTNVLKCDVSSSNTCSNAAPKKVNTVALPVQCDSKGSDLSIIDINKECKSGVTSEIDMYMCHNTSEASISVDRTLSVDHIKKPIDMESTNNVSLSENESLVVYKTLKPDVPTKHNTDHNIPSQLNACDTSDKDKCRGHNKHFTKLKPDVPTKHNTDYNIPSQLNVCDTRCSSHSEHVTNPIYTHLKLRTVHHYGYEFLYGINTVDPSRPLPGGIPKICDFLLDRIQRTGLVAYSPDQLTVNKYLPGAGIPPHIDTHSAFKDGIISLSLGSQDLKLLLRRNETMLTEVVMQFGHPYYQKIDALLPRRSLLVMTGESRYLWTHSIPSRKSDILEPLTAGFSTLPPEMQTGHVILQRQTRVSLTFRKIHCAVCECDYPDMCDNHI